MPKVKVTDAILHIDEDAGYAFLGVEPTYTGVVPPHTRTAFHCTEPELEQLIRTLIDQLATMRDDHA